LWCLWSSSLLPTLRKHANEFARRWGMHARVNIFTHTHPPHSQHLTPTYAHSPTPTPHHRTTTLTTPTPHAPNAHMNSVLTTQHTPTLPHYSLLLRKTPNLVLYFSLLSSLLPLASCLFPLPTPPFFLLPPSPFSLLPSPFSLLPSPLLLPSRIYSFFLGVHGPRAASSRWR
jgi:hypothetical protein